jgi:tRNA(Ile)-lysidine synthase
MKNKEFTEKLKGTIRRFELLQKGDRVLVALSGGPDSVALLFGLFAIKAEYDLKLFAAHLDHRLRGTESEEDEKFAANLARSLKLRFFSKRIDVRREAAKRKMTIEEAAREVRYQYLEKTASQIRADKIAVGHQADDQAETFLMRLLRGAGGAGLSGMPIKRGKIIRPLIQFRREEIESFLKANRIPHRIDSSNYLSDHFRNRIRLTLLPEIRKEFNPKIAESLNRAADIICLQQEYIRKKTEQILGDIGTTRKNRITFDFEEFSGYHVSLQREMIRLCVEQLKGNVSQLSFDLVDRTLELTHGKKTGKKVKLAKDIWFEFSPKELAFYRERSKKLDFPLTLPGRVNLRDWGIRINSDVVNVKSARPSLGTQDRNTAFLDWEKLTGPFRLRARRRGDKFRPLGMKGAKTVADFLIDAKVPRYLRDEVAILTSKGKIAWVVGYRVSDEFKVSHKTKEVLKIRATFSDSQET